MDSKVTDMDTTEQLDRRITAEIAAAAKAAGVSQRELAARTGIPLVTLTRRLGGTGKGFTVSELLAACVALDLSLTEVALRAERATPRAAAA